MKNTRFAPSHAQRLLASVWLTLGLALPAFSQAPPANNAAPASATPAAAVPPTWAQGRSPEQIKLNLTPNPPGVTAAAAEDIPVNQLKVPAGFKIELWATGLPNGRSMALSPSGILYVGSRFTGNVYAVIDKGDHREVKVLAKGLHRPNGVVFKDGNLYVAELERINRFDNIEAHLDAPPAPTVIFDALPKDEPHGWKFMTLSPDGKYLYFQIGTPANIVAQPVTHAQIVRLNLDTRIMETVASGVRNSVGMDFHPTTHELWFTNNGRDWVSEDLPNDTLNHITAKRMNFGYPFCHQGDLLDPIYGPGRSCDEFDKPTAKLGAHVAALGMRFYTGKQFPAEYKNNIFIAEHGSWNKSQKSGYQVIRVVLDKKGQVVKQEPFVTGWLNNNEFWGRPTDVQQLKDGSLLISDDETGAIFRVSYGK